MCFSLKGVGWRMVEVGEGGADGKKDFLFKLFISKKSTTSAPAT